MNTFPQDQERTLSFVQSLEKRSVSHISSHATTCCEEAKLWFLTSDQARKISQPLPEWIRHRWKWGPNTWPIHWCELIARAEIDCGALASLTAHALDQRGQDFYRAQIIQRYDYLATKNWSSRWRVVPGSASDWIDGPFAYHEVIALVIGQCNGRDIIRLWDSTDGCYLPEFSENYGGVVGIKLYYDGSALKEFLWNNKVYALNQWHTLSSQSLS